MRLVTAHCWVRPPRRWPRLSLLLFLLTEPLALTAQEGLALSTWNLCVDIDADGAPDTLSGGSDLDLHISPDAIRWGSGTVTRLQLPDWAANGSSVFATGDGRAIVVCTGRSLYTGTDTFAVVLLDRRIADRPAFIALGEDAHPLTRLRPGRELRDPAVRDLSGRIGFRLDPGSGGLQPQELTPPALAERISLFPNPTTGTLRIECDNLLEREYVFELFDMEGAKLQTRDVAGTTGRSVLTLDLSLLPVGRYQARLLRDGAVVAGSPVTIVR